MTTFPRDCRYNLLKETGQELLRTARLLHKSTALNLGDNMKALKKVAVLGSICALAATTAFAQPQAKSKQQVDIFATAKPGQWAEVKGPYQKDNTILASKIKFVSGTILEDDCEVSGKILSLDPQSNELKLVRQWPVKVAKDAEFKDKNGVATTLANLKPGMVVEAEGSYSKEGGFVAKEIEEDEIKEEEEADEVSVFGKIEKVDASGKTIQIMGITFVVNDQTKSKAAIK